MTPTDCVKKSLNLLCTRAGVDPQDGSHEAGEKVRAWYSRGWTDTGDANCPLESYLRRETGLNGVPYRGDEPFILVGVSRVMVFGPRTQGRRPVGFVGMPAAAVEALRPPHERRAPKRSKLEAAA